MLKLLQLVIVIICACGIHLQDVDKDFIANYFKSRDWNQSKLITKLEAQDAIIEILSRGQTEDKYNFLFKELAKYLLTEAPNTFYVSEMFKYMNSENIEKGISSIQAAYEKHIRDGNPIIDDI